MKTVGEFLKDMIFFSGMSQVEASAKLDISPVSLCEVIKGKRGLSIKVAKKLELLFGIPSIIWLTWQAYGDLNEN